MMLEQLFSFDIDCFSQERNDECSKKEKTKKTNHSSIVTCPVFSDRVLMVENMFAQVSHVEMSFEEQ